MKNRFTTVTTIVLAFAAGVTVSFFTLPLWVATAINAAKSGQPSDWLGFSGAALGAVATLAAGSAALFAAYRTLAPMRDQLHQLIRQNDHNLYDGLRKRASDLNDEIIVVEQICDASRIVDQALRSASQANPSIHAFGNFEASVDRFNRFVGDLQKRRGDTWGSPQIQFDRKVFIDHCLMMGAMAAHMVIGNKSAQYLSALILKRELPAWESHRQIIVKLGDKLYAHVTAEQNRIGVAIAKLEDRIFSR